MYLMSCELSYHLSNLKRYIFSSSFRDHFLFFYSYAVIAFFFLIIVCNLNHMFIFSKLTHNTWTCFLWIKFLARRERVDIEASTTH